MTLHKHLEDVVQRNGAEQVLCGRGASYISEITASGGSKGKTQFKQFYEFKVAELDSTGFAIPSYHIFL